MSPTAQTNLVTGGTGYIGSHTVVLLLEAGNKVVIVDSQIDAATSFAGLKVVSESVKQPE